MNCLIAFAALRSLTLFPWVFRYVPMYAYSVPSLLEEKQFPEHSILTPHFALRNSPLVFSLSQPFRRCPVRSRTILYIVLQPAKRKNVYTCCGQYGQSISCHTTR